MRHVTFTDGVHFLAMVGLATVVATVGGVTWIAAARTWEAIDRARNARAVKALGGAL